MNRSAIIIFFLFATLCMSAQDLKVSLSPDKNKVNRDTNNGVATIVFESTIKKLIIDDNKGDKRIDINDGLVFYLIPPEAEDFVAEYGYPRRRFILKSPQTTEYVLDVPEILPNTVLYYTVTLPNYYPLTLSAEYLFSQSAKYGIRVSVGNQFGGYFSYKWGEYRPSGNNLNDINFDVDLTHSEYLGYIRKSITGGARFGLLKKNISRTNNALFLLIGGGYGEYGRQWKNASQINGNIYFYTDYMKGFEGELALQLTALDWITLSAGADMLVANGKVSIDYMIGVGLNLNFNKLKKKKL